MREKNPARVAGIGLVLLAVAVVAKATGLTEYIGLYNRNVPRDWIDGFGVTC